MIERWPIGLVYLAVEGSSILASQESPTSSARRISASLLVTQTHAALCRGNLGIGSFENEGRALGDEGHILRNSYICGSELARRWITRLTLLYPFLSFLLLGNSLSFTNSKYIFVILKIECPQYNRFMNL